MRALALSLVFVACSSIRYDKPPSPAWIDQTPTKMDAGMVEVVGITAATEDARGDAERAFAAAKQRLAEALVSQVRTQSNDWSWSSGTKEQVVVEQNVEVRTDIQLEGVTQIGAYRDETTGSQYVKARVDMGAFVGKIRARLQPTIDQLAQGLADAKAMEQQRTVEAYLSLLKLRNVANGAMGEVRLLNVIAPRDEALSKFRAQMKEIEDLTKGVASRASFVITATGPDPATNDRMKAAAREVLVRWGFNESAAKDPAVRLTLTIDSKKLPEETRGGRTEFVYGAAGSARLQQRAGDWNALSATLQEGRYTETHASEPEAKRRALQSGADTLISMWRSLGRSLTQ